MDFRGTHVFSVKKAGNSANFAAGGIITRSLGKVNLSL
jgi:hypothetical protein